MIDEQFLVNLMSRIAQYSLLGTHIKKLKDFSTRRKIQDASKQIGALALDMVSHTSETALNRAQALVTGLDIGQVDDKLKHAHEFLKKPLVNSGSPCCTS